ncbi:hypothetical protein KBB96_10705 [Luteolibacter ambystomatis]|uniref:Verru_Chthon cassette protein A n=1 Tax=Luteolibacter ambystomatis TaxID=2824561 RepID=A0A975G5W4_9BACT|nr:hypothetical protein [Luteolibacter ambystomatis]QUE49341.1 hypothetical protein KBB96_10705 [Luteolibacter ambystomatis]
MKTLPNHGAAPHAKAAATYASPPPPRVRGFSLIVVMMMMMLLCILALGLLSLSTVTLRSSGQHEMRARAMANARLSVALALSRLQQLAGDDRRITADGDLVAGTSRKQAVGVWESWSPRYCDDPTRSAPDYAKEKRSRFRGWLLSRPDAAVVETEDEIKNAPQPSWPSLFRLQQDGFDLKAAPVTVKDGAAAWAVVQENTKAKLNVGGPDQMADMNDVLAAQPRPNPALNPPFLQPKDGWNLRSARVTDLKQVQLDSSLISADTPVSGLGKDYTTHATGLLTNPVDGGLKTDLNLGFDLSDGEFSQTAWNNSANPFRSETTGYKGQKPLHAPMVSGGQVQLTANYGEITYTHKFNCAGIPTFDTLRSFYRIPRHLYLREGPTAFERPPSNISWPVATGKPDGQVSQTAVRPVLDRLLYFISEWVDAQKQVNLVFTPVVTLWNPHDVAVETQGLVIYPWMDFPLSAQWNLVDQSGTRRANPDTWLSLFTSGGTTGRNVDPYFFLNLTADGSASPPRPVRLGPGEVRVFSLVDNAPRFFDRRGSEQTRTWRMRPVDDPSQFNTKGGIAIRLTTADSMNGSGFPNSMQVQPTDRLDGTIRFTRGQHHYFISMEDAGRMNGKPPSLMEEIHSHNNVLGDQTFAAPTFTGSELAAAPKMVGVLETYHRVAVDANQVADLAYTTNPRQTFVNSYLTGGGSFASGPHYESAMRQCASVSGAGLQLTPDGRCSYYGASNAASNGRSKLAFFELPRAPLLSIAGFQHADLAPTAFGPSNQAGNSWASAYLPSGTVAKVMTAAASGEKFSPAGLPVVDTSFLVNEALWDSFFFSGLAPTFTPREGSGSPSMWTNGTASASGGTRDLLTAFVTDPVLHPLKNTSMVLTRRGMTDKALVDRLAVPEGCLRIASHLMVDGAFNVNSTSVNAWSAVLAGLRGTPFKLDDGSPSGATVYENGSPFPRFRYPSGSSNDAWSGYRSLDDGRIRKLAEEMVAEVKKRGPFFSLGEFVNRQPTGGASALSGALQTAIDRTGLNNEYLLQTFNTGNYPNGANINPAKTGVGIPGYLTEADVLGSIGARLTVRSDTFIIRGYGEAHDPQGKPVAQAWCEAVVQRTPDWVDSSQPPETKVAALTPVNKTFGRRFTIVSFRYIPAEERNTSLAKS